MSQSNLYHHYYPSWLMRNPSLIRLVYGTHWLVHLHKWYLYPEVVERIKVLPRGAVLADVGFGEGQYSLGFSTRFPACHYYLIDRHQDHLDFAKAFNANCTASISLLHKDAATFQLPELADLMLCIGVLQYCPDDLAVLQNMKSQLKLNGKLLLYVPVNGREILPFYRWLRARWPDYESIQSRQRVYRVAEIEAKLANAGFKLSNRKFTYGTLGILSNEWLNSFFLVMVHGSILLKVLATFLFGLTWPLMLLAMLFDFLQSHKNGNCLLMVAEPN